MGLTHNVRHRTALVYSLIRNARPEDALKKGRNM